MFSFKKKKVACSPEPTTELEAFVMWEVRWESNHRKYKERDFNDYNPELKGFPDKESAKLFYNAIKQSHITLGNTGNGNYVELFCDGNYIMGWLAGER